VNRLTLAASLLAFSGTAFAQLSTLLDAEGMACIEDKSVSNAEQLARRAAFTDARRAAVEMTQSHIKSTTQIENYVVQEDLVESFVEADVKVLEVLEETWDASRDCIVVRLHTEVTPEWEELAKQELLDSLLADPTAPLTVKLWTNKTIYQPGDTMQIFVKGNKPFYGMLTYTDADNNTLQILPNPNRKSDHFNGGVVYSVPGHGDTFSITMEPPFGREKLSLYARTTPLGRVDKNNIGPAYSINDDAKGIAEKTRGISLNLVAQVVAEDGTMYVPIDERIAEFNQVTVDVEVEQPQP